MRRKWMRRGMVVLALGLSGAGSAAAQQKGVVEDILEILRSSRQISEQQFRDLLIKARAEEGAKQAVLESAKQAALEIKKQDPSALRVYWKDGIRLDSGDGGFKLKLGGRIMNDWALFDEDGEVKGKFGTLGSGPEFRRARLSI